MPQRIPSPRELQYHTQSIMQNALIRKKLEEQRENYRKRQEQEKKEIAQKNQQDQSASSSSDSNLSSDQVVTTMAPSMSQEEKILQPESPKKIPIAQTQLRQHAPSPSIFTLTPTSVLRKMTADKDSDALKNEKKKLLASMPQQAPMRNAPQQPQPPFMGNNNVSQMDRLKMAQNDASGMQFGGMNAWNNPPPHPEMKPIGKLQFFTCFIRRMYKTINVFQRCKNFLKLILSSLGRPIVKSSTVPGPQQNNAQPGMMNNFEFQQQQKMQNIQKAQFLQMQMKKQQMDNPVLSQFMQQQQQRAVQAQNQFRPFPQQQQQMNFPMMRQDKPEEQSNF